jgi:hypothetical protein
MRAFDIEHSNAPNAFVHFGPKAPAGKEKNRVQTIPGNGCNPILRLYSPLEPWFNN